MMDQVGLHKALAAALPERLAQDLAAQFVAIRRDVATRTLGRASPGKFVESLVQALQALENSGTFDAQPNVDQYLRQFESGSSSLPDGLRICAARLGRAMYSLRNKRSIVHKGEVDPALYDLRLLYSGSQWILTELLALSSGIQGKEAAKLIEDIQLPVGELVEEIDGRRIVHGSLTVRQELLVLLLATHPNPTSTKEVLRSMDRRSTGSVRNVVTDLWKEKLVHRTVGNEILLTEAGLRAAIGIAQLHVA